MPIENLILHAEKLIMISEGSSDSAKDEVDANVNAIDKGFMAQALLQADTASELDEVPVGAVVVYNGQVIASGYNRPIADHDASAHAEINALRAAGKALGNYRLPECTLYVTLEPCTMCLGAMVHARIKRLVFAASEPRAGAVESQLALLDQTFFNHRIDWCGGILAQESSDKLKQFFKRRRG